MAYTPDANDLAEPTSGRPAGTAAAEFRAIKAKIASIVAGSVLVGAANYVGPSGLVDFLHIDSRYSHRDLVADGWYPAFFNQQWGGSPHYYELNDAATGTVSKFEAATGYIEYEQLVAFGNVAGAGFGRGQGFKVSKNTTVKAIWLRLVSILNPTDNVRVRIFNDAAGVPGAVIANGTANTISGRRVANYNTTTGYSAWYKFTFAIPPTVNANTQYHWVVDRSGAADAANYYNVARRTTTAQYPHGVGCNSTNADVMATEPGTDHLFLLESVDADQSITTGGVFNDGKYTFFEGTPLNQSNARCKDLKDLKGFTVQDFTLALYGASWTKDKTILDITYGLDHDRIVLRCNPATGFPSLTIYEKDGTIATVTGTTDISTATNRLIGIRVRARNDGADTIQVWVNGTKEAELTAQSYEFDEVFVQAQLGTFWLGGGWQVMPAWTQKLDMSALPSTAGWTFTTTTATAEANVFSVSGGKLNQVAGGMAAGGDGYYSKAAAGFTNAAGGIMVVKARVGKGTNTISQSSSWHRFDDGSRLHGFYLAEYFAQFFSNGGFVTASIPQVELRYAENVIALAGKGNDDFLFLNGKLIIDATGYNTSASALTTINFGDAATAANENSDITYDYVAYYNTAWLVPQITGGTFSEFMLWQGDKTALFATLYNAGVLLSGKQILGVNNNRLLEVTVPHSLMQAGITTGPTTTSSGERLTEMHLFAIGDFIKAEHEALLQNSGVASTYIIGPLIDGAFTEMTNSNTYGGSSAAAGLQVTGVNTVQKKVNFGLHKINSDFGVNANTGTAVDRHRHLRVEARTS